jgi:hypothetical protein
MERPSVITRDAERKPGRDYAIIDGAPQVGEFSAAVKASDLKVILALP